MLLRVDLARANPARLDRTPAIGALVFVFFEDEVAPLAAIEVPHRRVGLLDSLEEVQDGLAIGRQFHLRAEIHVDVEIVAQGRIAIHSEGPFFPEYRAARRNLSKASRFTRSIP